MTTDPREMGSRGTRGEDPARFLRELRELRSHAGLGCAELAARAHYPYDAIKAAEAGPALPDLPVLSAYVRGCGGTVAEWEERWRAATGSPASPLLTARATGWSAAADAGARVGAACVDAGEPDADHLMAALSRVADGIAMAPAPAGPGDDHQPPAQPAAQPPVSAGLPVVVPGQGTRLRPPPPSGATLPPRATLPHRTTLPPRMALPPRTTLAAVAAVTLLLIATVLALFA